MWTPGSGGSTPAADDSHDHTQATLPPLVNVVPKAADESIANNDVLHNDLHLTATFAADKTYWFAVLLHATDATAAAAGGIQIALGGTAILANMVSIAKLGGITTLTGGYLGVARFTALGQIVAEAGGEDSPFCTIEGTVDVTTGGTFLVRWAQTAATAGNLTVLKGSVLKYQEISS